MYLISREFCNLIVVENDVDLIQVYSELQQNLNHDQWLAQEQYWRQKIHRCSINIDILKDLQGK